MGNKDGFYYLETLTPWGGRGDFDLNGIRHVLEHLGNPQDKIPSIHVAGTNGKGSVSTFIASGLAAAGFAVGLNISPHLSKINERFVINGLPVSDEWINKHALQIKEAATYLGILLSFHEALTAIAFVGFSCSDLDYIVIEVGVGGLLDASNVIAKPKACVITSIGLDHQDILGNTIADITKQKAGIIKKHSQVFIGHLSSESAEIIQQICEQTESTLHETLSNYEGQLNLPGEHQKRNAQLAKKVLTSFGLPEFAIKEGLEQAFWPGRLECATIEEANNRQILIDCAHNPDGMTSLAEYLYQNSIVEVHLIFGTLETKDWKQNIDILAPFIKTFAYLRPDSIKSLPGDTIYSYLENRVKFTELDWQKDNILNYINMLDTNKLILLTGSIYTVGKLRSLLDIKDKPLWIRKH